MTMKQGFQLVKVKLQNERSVVLFRTHPYQPVLVPFIYSTLNLKGLAFKTIEEKLASLKYLYSYYSIYLNYDLDELLINPKRHLIVFQNLNAFISHLVYDGSVIGVRSREIYIRSISEFLVWSNRRYFGPVELIDSIRNLSQTFLRSLPSPVPNDDSSLNRNEIELIFIYSNPSHLANPFRKYNRNRNSIILNLLLSTGIRLGELLKLKSADIYEVHERYYIEILNHENDSDDSRADEPGLKNNQSMRMVSIDSTLYQAIQKFIINERRPVKHGKKIKLNHGYLLTSERGLPLSKGSIYDILKKLREGIVKDKNNFKTTLSPHAFRHAFAETFLEHLIDNKDLDMERAKDQLRAIGGWSTNSSMPTYYAKKYISRQANSHNLDRINSSVKKLKENGG